MARLGFCEDTHRTCAGLPVVAGWLREDFSDNRPKGFHTLALTLETALINGRPLKYSIRRSKRARQVKVQVCQRDGVVVVDGRTIESLRRVKEDVREVRAGTECGIRLVGFEDLKVEDQLICYNVISVTRKLSRAAG